MTERKLKSGCIIIIIIYIHVMYRDTHIAILLSLTTQAHMKEEDSLPGLF